MRLTNLMMATQWRRCAERGISGVEEQMNERNENLYSSVLEEESSLLLSAAPKEAAKSLDPVEVGDHRVAVSESMEKKVLVERIRAELAIRRREDSTRPTVRRPRLDKIKERVPSSLDSHTAVTTLSARESVEPVAERERRESTKNIVFTDRTKAPKENDSPKTFMQAVYGIPILGYCLELVVLLFGLPVQLREINSRAAKKDAVMLARIDGIGSRVNALREGIAQCRQELEEAMAAKAALEDMNALSDEISQKADTRRLDAFSRELDAELSKKTSEETLDEVKAFIEMSLDDLRVEISRKAEEKQLVVLEESLKSKADEQVLDELSGRIDDAFARLDSYDEFDAASRLKSLEAILAEVHAETSLKADAEGLASLQSEYRTRAESDADSFSALKGELAGLSERIGSFSSDLGVIGQIESKLETLAGLLDSFDMDSLVRRMQSVETALDAKADLEIIKSLLNLGVDVEVLKTLCKGLEKSSDDVLSVMGKKADTAALDALNRRIEFLSKGLESLEHGADEEKGRSEEFGRDLSLGREKLQALEDHIHAIASSFDSKADSEAVSQLSDRVEGRLAAKVDTTSLQELLSAKAEVKDLQSIRSIFEERLEELKLIIKRQEKAAGEDERRMAGSLNEARKTKDLSYTARVKGRSVALRELKPEGRKGQGGDQRDKSPQSGERVKK